MTKLDPQVRTGKVRIATGVLTYDTQTANSYSFDDKIILPKGAVVVGGSISTSVTCGSTATIALGITGTTGKYRAAATLTNTTLAAIAIPHAALIEPLAAEEEVVITNAAASLPAAGTMKVIIEYVMD